MYNYMTHLLKQDYTYIRYNFYMYRNVVLAFLSMRECIILHYQIAVVIKTEAIGRGLYSIVDMGTWVLRGCCTACNSGDVQ